ncbi:uncharacterized protein IWZ02DRAFT_311049 [Phyllosticta citriasiana]|uniref:uncharacterized protein n=1 Tax=Phyllosticta citriasiana TaxID=595635 RepID=UPI0030FD2904
MRTRARREGLRALAPAPGMIAMTRTTMKDRRRRERGCAVLRKACPRREEKDGFGVLCGESGRRLLECASATPPVEEVTVRVSRHVAAHATYLTLPHQWDSRSPSITCAVVEIWRTESSDADVPTRDSMNKWVLQRHQTSEICISPKTSLLHWHHRIPEWIDTDDSFTTTIWHQKSQSMYSMSCNPCFSRLQITKASDSTSHTDPKPASNPTYKRLAQDDFPLQCRKEEDCRAQLTCKKT